jgi:hypothetical protein
MGGIAIELDPAYSPFFGGMKRITLTAKGVALLAHCGHLPEISVDDIRDKNKADSLAKLLVCFQAGWMIVQVIYRQGIGLPSSLLEVHTVAHVVCALLMYAIWWHKPRQVVSPTLLYGESMLPLAAYMYSASRMSGQKPRGKLRRLLNPRPELKQMVYLDEEGKNTVLPVRIATEDGQHGISEASTRNRFVPIPLSPTSRHHQERDLALPEDHASRTRRRLAAKAVAEYPAIRAKFQKLEGELKEMLYSDLNERYLVPYAAELVQPYSLNWPNAGLLRRTESLVMGMTLWGASMAYGAIHVAAWHYFFPTYAEKLLWHLSSVWVTFCAAFWLMVHVLAYFFPIIDRIWIAYNERRLGLFWTSVITLLCVLCGVSFVGSRGFLVVEAFVSIRVVPIAVYETPSWSQVFPHL